MERKIINLEGNFKGYSLPLRQRVCGDLNVTQIASPSPFGIFQPNLSLLK